MHPAQPVAGKLDRARQMMRVDVGEHGHAQSLFRPGGAP
jgi:hypothetical protein